jgi:chromosome segregation ATPase
MASFQARITLLRLQIAEIKQELKIIMSDLEKTNLEAHVDLCAERYKGLHDRLSAIEQSLKRISDDMLTSHKSSNKTLIMTAGTVVAGLLSTIVVVLMKIN